MRFHKRFRETRFPLDRLHAAIDVVMCDVVAVTMMAVSLQWLYTAMSLEYNTCK